VSKECVEKITRLIKLSSVVNVVHSNGIHLLSPEEENLLVSFHKERFLENTFFHLSGDLLEDSK